MKKPLIGILAALAIFLLGFLLNRRDFFIAYLEGYLFFSGLALGCLGIWMVHNLVGGQWGDPIGRVLQAASGTLPLLAILFVPILLGLSSLFPWADAAHHPPSLLLSRKLWYLNPQFFTLRAILVFLVWLLLFAAIKKQSAKASNDLANPESLKLQNRSGVGLVLLFFTGTFASIDWILSLEPEYYSTIWGFLILMQDLLGAFAFCLVAAILASSSRIQSQKLNDLGNLLLMSVILWTYMAFSQYLITWSGQIKAEISWYNARFLGGWQWFGGILLVFNFAIPFVCLLFRRFKRDQKAMFILACLFLTMQWVGIVWLVEPAFSPMHFRLSWQDILIPLALALIWVSYLRYLLSKNIPPLPRGNSEIIAHYAA